jgi:hypothetical protein
MNRREFLRTSFIFAGCLWIPKLGIFGSSLTKANTQDQYALKTPILGVKEAVAGPYSYFYTGTNITSDPTNDSNDPGASAAHGAFIQIGTTGGTITSIGIQINPGRASVKMALYNATAIGTLSGALIEGTTLVRPVNGWNDYTLTVPASNRIIPANGVRFVGYCFSNTIPGDHEVRKNSGTFRGISAITGPPYANFPGTNLSQWDNLFNYRFSVRMLVQLES